jgi:IS30 family transposase
MTYYTQLTQEERYHISVLCKEGFPRAEIARRVKRHPSTITRELRRKGFLTQIHYPITLDM